MGIIRAIFFEGKPGSGPEPEKDPAPFGLWDEALAAVPAAKEALRVLNPEPPKRGENHPTVVSPEAKAAAATMTAVRRGPGRPRKASK